MALRRAGLAGMLAANVVSPIICSTLLLICKGSTLEFNPFVSPLSPFIDRASEEFGHWLDACVFTPGGVTYRGVIHRVICSGVLLQSIFHFSMGYGSFFTALAMVCKNPLVVIAICGCLRLCTMFFLFMTGSALESIPCVLLRSPFLGAYSEDVGSMSLVLVLARGDGTFREVIYEIIWLFLF